MPRSSPGSRPPERPTEALLLFLASIPASPSSSRIARPISTVSPSETPVKCLNTRPRKTSASRAGPTPPRRTSTMLPPHPRTEVSRTVDVLPQREALILAPTGRCRLSLFAPHDSSATLGIPPCTPSQGQGLRASFSPPLAFPFRRDPGWWSRRANSLYRLRIEGIVPERVDTSKALRHGRTDLAIHRAVLLPQFLLP